MDIQDNVGKTALIYSTVPGYSDIVSVLLAHNASPEIGDNKGGTALMQAASEGHNDIVIELLSHNASKHIDTQDTGKRQWNALSYAAHFGELEVVKTLLKHGANQQNKGTTAFHVAQQKGHREVMSYLENYRFNIEGTTALMKAATRGNNKQVLKLLAEKALHWWMSRMRRGQRH